MSPKTTPSAAKLKPAAPIAEAGLRFSGEILITRISMDHSIQPRDRAAGQRDELAALHGRRSSRWGPHNTTPLLKKAAVHRSKIEYPRQRWVIASDGDAPNAHRGGERVAFHDNQYRVFPGLVAHSVNATWSPPQCVPSRGDRRSSFWEPPMPTLTDGKTIAPTALLAPLIVSSK